MDSLADLVGRVIAAEPARTQNPGFRLLDVALPLNGTEPASAAYEIEVFNYLVAQKEKLGIKEVWKCRSIRIDGLLELASGQRLGLEIKFRMNWEKACQAGHQFSWFRGHPEAKTRRLTSGLVVFEEFSGDWARRSPSRLLENGWNYWYTDHHAVDGLRVDLVRLRSGTIESLPSALAVARAANNS